MHNAIKKIELDLGGKIVSLTPEQAKNLKDALDELFGKDVIREITIPIIKEKEIWREPYLEPYPAPCRPLSPSWEWQPHYYSDRVTCDSYVGPPCSYYSDSGTLKLTC